MKHISELQSVLSEQQYSELAKLILEAVEEAHNDGYIMGWRDALKDRGIE